MEKQSIRDSLARRLARIMRYFVLDPRYFELCQAHGYHVKPVHFYSPLPDARELPKRIWSAAFELPGLELNEPRPLRLPEACRARYRPGHEILPAVKPAEPFLARP